MCILKLADSKDNKFIINNNNINNEECWLNEKPIFSSEPVMEPSFRLIDREREMSVMVSALIRVVSGNSPDLADHRNYHHHHHNQNQRLDMSGSASSDVGSGSIGNKRSREEDRGDDISSESVSRLCTAFTDHQFSNQGSSNSVLGGNK